ncbi:MAG: hypothetical protein CXZ00_14355 [Acidobacteria bacterium]|nr:MAG: hypothetical protein CXZ00_14355 [Acidobacteriota bacterium]
MLNPSRQDSPLQGSVLFFALFDVCEEIDLGELVRMLGLKPGVRSFKHSAPEYVRFQRAPVEDQFDVTGISGFPPMTGKIKYFDYGVVSLVFEAPFQGGWEDMVESASRWLASTEFELYAEKVARRKVAETSAALIHPYETWLSEDYLVFYVESQDNSPTASELRAQHGTDIARVVRGDPNTLSSQEYEEVLRDSISYYPNDLAIIGWNAAFIYDTKVGAETTIQLLEYANSQLLEFRHYDELLSKELVSVNDALRKRGGVFDKWRLGREASKLQAVAVEITELVEQADNSIKFLSDMFSARLYRLAASKVGVQDYKRLVNQKLHTAEALYDFLSRQFHEGRGFVLELMVVIILVIELIYLFRGKM